MDNIAEEAESSGIWKIISMVLLGSLALFSAAFMLGYFIGHFSKENPEITIKFIGILLIGLLITTVSILSFIRLYRSRSEAMGPITKKEKLNRNILIIAMILGGIIGLTVVLASPDLGQDPWVIFSDSPLPPALAITVSVLCGLLVPLLSYYWHTKVIDEQESYVTAQAAIWALYVYMIATPVWWFLWRGGLVPEVNGLLVYFATTLIFGILWLKNKYG
ncbi:hypothetical protein ACR9YC_05100 [Parasphingorhabdus sp. DH2-15]|uniref:hypothetical protein n=1 Tax=Parasphingorhabdus sp. DH2-15 TaxID=3444112 RepID=UPI003F6832AC